MKLYYAPASPYARKVRVAAHELGLADRITLERIAPVPGRPDPAYAAVNPLRKIPALVTGDGDLIVDSTVICEYLDTEAGGGAILPTARAARFRALTAQAVATGICDALLLARYEAAVRPEPLRWSDWTDDQRNKAETGIAWFEARAASFTKAFEIDQIALGCALAYADYRFSDMGWRDRNPALARWFEPVAARPSFRATPPE